MLIICFIHYFLNLVSYYVHSYIFHGVLKILAVYLVRPFGNLCNLVQSYTDRATDACRRTFADRGCRVVSATDPYGRILGFLDRSRYYFFQVVPQLYSRGWVDPVPDPLLLRKSGSAGNRIRNLWICSQKLWPLDHRGGRYSSLAN
jgi:hypothetical protein